MKFVMPVVQAIGLNCGPEGGLSRIREIYHSGRKAPTLSGGTLRFFHYGTQYIDFSMRQARVEPGMLRGLRVVLDCFNGAAGPEIFSALDLAGVELHPMRLMPDGTFPTGSPSPTSQGKMNGAVELAKSLGGALVVGVDGDGDRIVFGDQRGILSAGFVLLPILRASGIDPKARVPQPVLYDPKVNPLALAEWGKLNVQPVLFRNGHSQIKDYMNSIGALAAGEESGHYYHRIKLGPHTVSVENSILTILLFLASANAQNELLDRLWELQRNIFNTGEFNYQFDSDERRDLAMQRVIDHFTNKGATTVTKTPEGIDLEGTVLSRGVTLSAASVSLDPGWFSGYLRIATNEKSVVRAYFSAGDTDSGRRVEMEARHILEQDFRGRVID
jgi:phosphomannomutase